MTTSQPSSAIRAPLGAKPWNVPGSGEGRPGPPADGGARRGRWSCRRSRTRSRGTPRTAPRSTARMPSGAVSSCWPTSRSMPPGRPAGDGGVEVVRGQRLEVALGDLRGRGHRAARSLRGRRISCAAMAHASASWGAASGSCPGCGGCACRCRGPASPTATRGRSPPARGSCWSTPGCTSPARWPSSSARCDQVKLRLEHVQLLAMHPRALRPLGPGGADRRARRLRDVDAPQPRARHRTRRRSRAGAGAADGGGAPSGVPEAALRALRRAGQGHALRDRAGDRARPRRWSPGSRSRPTSASGTCTRRPGTRRRTSACSSPSGGC